MCRGYILVSTSQSQMFTSFSYECIGGRNDALCNRYTGTSCGYGLFGCIKIATYSGGVDKSEENLSWC